jgi:transposase-like protein
MKLTHDVAKILNMSDSSLRRWCRELESHGYQFVLGEDEARVFREEDIEALQFLQELVKIQRKKLEEGAKEVARLYSRPTPVQSRSMPIPSTEVEQIKEQLISEIMELKQKLNSIDLDYQEMKINVNNLARQVYELKQMEEKKLYMEYCLDKRDKEIMMALREIHQTKKAVAAAKQKKWWKFWK